MMIIFTKFEVDMTPSPNYSVVDADTLRDLDLLTVDSGHTWRVMWSTLPPSLKILRLSVLKL